MKKILIAPSLLACKKGEEKEQIAILTSAGADILHFDVMDGKFVPNVSFSEEDYLYVRSFCRLPMDVHIMVENPMNYVDFYGRNGAKILTFHYEALNDDKERIAVLKMIRSYSMLAGISIKPQTNPIVLLPLLKYIDVILIMSVEPGKGGQAFLQESLEKISYFREIIDEKKLPILIEVDGGINEITGKSAVQAGADILVAGSYLFHKEDVQERIESLKKKKDDKKWKIPSPC